MASWRKTDPETSKAAALSITEESLTKTQQLILEQLRKRALCDIALVSAVKLASPDDYFSESGIRSRRSELVALGKVIDTGERIKLASGRQAIVWKAA